MAATANHRIFDEMLEPVGRCLTPGVAARIAALRAGPKTQERLDELAAKNSEGTLMPREDAEYEAYVEALDVIAVLQGKALKGAGPSRRRQRQSDKGPAARQDDGPEEHVLR